MDPGGSTSSGVIRTATRYTLRCAESHGLRSLGLVAFGTGVGGFALERAAEIELDEVGRHLRSGSALERIVFRVRGQSARAAFERALATARAQQTFG
jgi:O-acetyl-ADP-ribose deacetylase (regulator of RNase III)